MSRLRTVFKSGHSLVVALPEPVRTAMDIRKGDSVLVTPISATEIKLTLVKTNDAVYNNENGEDSNGKTKDA